jgi:hypothetical protein
MLTVPALAQYTLTLRLILPTGETLWTATLPYEVDNTTLTVPEPLYVMIVTIYGTDTFTTPFNLTFFGIGPACTLEVTSDPPGFTVTFEPMTVPDVNDDGAVDLYDLVTVAHSITVNPGMPDNYDMFLDLTFDLQIDIFDLVEIAKHIEITI